MLSKGLLNVVLDGFWGSCGKGKVCDWLAATCGVTDLVSGNMPNAGHTVVRGEKKYVAKVMPSAAFFNPNTRIWLSGSSGFTAERFLEELAWIQNGRDRVTLSERAFTVNEEHARYERDSLNHIASTMQGSAAALVDKIMRGSSKTVRGLDFPTTVSRDFRSSLGRSLIYGTMLYEVAQGWGLSIDHGTHYPNCTSRNCSTQRALDDCAVAPQLLGEVVAVIRPYPIRVGNTEGGYSGGWMPDCAEVDWQHVARVSGLTDELSQNERTTVTKRVRRVSTFSFELLRDAVISNGVTKIFLNFAQYVDAAATGLRGKGFGKLPTGLRVFIDAIQMSVDRPVIAVGTGADTFDVVEA